MRHLLIAALSLAASVSSARATGRFFLFVADGPPQADLVMAAYRASQRPVAEPDAPPPLSPEVARARLGKAFPRLFGGGRTIDRTVLEADLKAGRAAHFNGQYQESEAAFARVLDALKDEPESLSDGKLFQRLVDGAATRYRNTLARKRPKSEARAQIEAFLWRYPMATPTASEHAPEVLAVWNEVRAGAKAQLGSLVVNVHPVELERAGGCTLALNGAELAALPQPGPLGVPRGEHLLQVRCGPQIGWLQRVAIGAAPVALRVPVRAMLSARGDTASGGVVLVAPAEEDAPALVDAVSAACDLAGAVVAVAAESKVRLGSWRTASEKPELAHVGRIEGTEIEDVRALNADSGAGSGRLWTWIVGGIGLATLGGAVVANVITADKITSGQRDVEGLKTTTVALYVAGGALVAAGIVLFFVEGDDERDSEASYHTGPGGLIVRF